MKALLRKKEALVQRIIDRSDFLRGSITSVCSTCNRAGCICTGRSEERTRAYRLTYKDKQQKTRTVESPFYFPAKISGLKADTISD